MKKKTSGIILGLVAALFALVLSGCSTMSTKTSVAAQEKPTILLVHGAFEDASVWGHVVDHLKTDGYTAVAINLPGRPSNPLAVDKITLDLYRDTVLSVIAQQKGPVVLVGHSFGGIVISAVGEAAPEKIKTLVFVAAYLPKDGESLLSLAQSDRDAKIGPHLIISKETGLASIEFAARADLLANDGPEGLRSVLPKLVVDEPVAPLGTPVHVTAARFGKIDKSYVHTSKDQVVSPYLQDKMVAATPVRYSTTLDTGHTPFLTNPDGLALAIEKAAE